jgi:chromosome segregation ATPase
MGLGGTAKKLQKVASLAEDSYQKMNELREQLTQLRNEVQSTSRQVDGIERDLAEQRALLEALADEQDLDVDSIIADANIEDIDADENGTADGNDATSDSGDETAAQ